MAKFKHNKKRNSAFLYEILVQELTKSIIEDDVELKKKITQLVKESFAPGSMMYRELKLFKTISQTRGAGVLTAEKIMNEVKIRHKDIDKKQLVSEQNKLTRKIRKILSDDVFSNFVPSYKDLASIGQIFNQRISVKSKILLENEVVKNMTLLTEDQEMVPMDNIIYKSFAKRFNNEYGGKLLPEQKVLLNKFVTSFYNNGLELSAYLNDEIGRLKEDLSDALKKDILLSDSEMTENAKNVVDLLESYKSQPPCQKMVVEVIKIQELVKEINTHVN